MAVLPEVLQLRRTRLDHGLKELSSRSRRHSSRALPTPPGEVEAPVA